MEPVSEQRSNLSEQTRRLLQARSARGFAPPPSMLDAHIQLLKLETIPEELEQLTPPAERLDWAQEVSPPASEIATVIEEAEAPEIGEVSPPEATAVASNPTSAELAAQWKQLSAELDEVFEWRQETHARETQVFARFEAFLDMAGNRGKRHTEGHRRYMIATQEVRQVEAKVLNKAIEIEEALTEEREAREEIARFQEETRKRANALQAKINAAREKRYTLSGCTTTPKRCHQCKLEGVHRGRECPNLANHASQRK